MADQYESMIDLYEDPANIQGTTYGKRWRRHEWTQLVEGNLLTIRKVKRLFSRCMEAESSPAQANSAA